jgi:two-component system, chemotaxis family, chemotaxis protein CheY
MIPQKSHILVVEDEPFMRKTIKLMLKQICDARLSEARSGAEAFDMLKAERPDLVLCDIGMEGMDGLALLKAARESGQADLSKLPFVMLTGHSEQAKVSAALKLGISGYLVKPVSPKQLAERLAVVLST